MKDFYKGGYPYAMRDCHISIKRLQDVILYRKRYDPHYPLIPPHLTLKDAFEADENNLDAITKKLKMIASKYKPFLLKAYKISSFHPVNNVIFFKVEKTPELEGLFNDFESAFGHPAEYPFVPHITIAQNLTNSEHADVYSQLRLQKIDHEEQVDRIHLVYQLDNGAWNVYETFLLGK